MSDRILLAYGVAFITWRVWYHAPEKVRLRRYRKDRAADVLHADGRDV